MKLKNYNLEDEYNSYTIFFHIFSLGKVSPLVHLYLSHVFTMMVVNFFVSADSWITMIPANLVSVVNMRTLWCYIASQSRLHCVTEYK